MTSKMQSLWAGAIRPMLKRPPALQVAALCHRDGTDGPEVMLVTSSSGRWILPKGWPVDGLTTAQAAKQEAWEEGGVEKGKVEKTALGRFLSEKRFDNGAVIPCETQVFPIAVKSIANDYPESEQRDRIWVSPAKAAEMVDDPGLSNMLETFAAA